MPNRLVPLVVEIVQEYLKAQEEAALAKLDKCIEDHREELLRRGLDVGHPQANQGIEQETDFWSSEKAIWATTQTSWDIACS